jgi:hypothetical protein
MITPRAHVFNHRIPAVCLKDREELMKRFILLAVASLLALAPRAHADSKNTTTLSSPDGQYELTLPDSWEAADFHVDKVQIGAENKSRGEYVEVIAENQRDYTDSLTRYAQAKRDTMALSLDNPRLTEPQQTKINGLPAVRCEIHGQLPNTNTAVGYLLTVIKTKTHYIQIVAWVKDSHFSDRKGDLTSLADGFSETSRAGK